jgi:hypothetical protein
MTQQKDGARRADYGLDAPGALYALAILGVATILLGTPSYVVLRQALPELATVLLSLGTWGDCPSRKGPSTSLPPA